MKTIRVVSIFLARFFLSLFFLVSGTETLLNWHDMEKNLMDALCEWQSYLGFSESVQSCLTEIVPWMPFLLLAGAVCELLGGLALLFGYRERFGAVLLVILFIPATLLFHGFWLVDGPARDMQEALFFRNLAILGGLLLVAIHGAQAMDEGKSSFSSMGLS